MPGATTLLVFSSENTKVYALGKLYYNLHIMIINKVESKIMSKL